MALRGRNLETGESKRKIELVALIDVIFLLLIFFLVTLNISAALGGSEDLEGTYGIEMMDSEHEASGKSIVAVLPFGDPRRIVYLMFNGSASERSGARDEFDDLSVELKEAVNDDTSDMNTIDWIMDGSAVESRYFENPEEIRRSLRDNNTDRVVILSPGEVTYGRVHRLLRVCRSEGVSSHQVITCGSIEDMLDRLGEVNLDLKGKVIRKDG